MSAAETILGKWKSDNKREGGSEEFWASSGLDKDVSNMLATKELILEVYKEGGKHIHKISVSGGPPGKANQFVFGKEGPYENEYGKTKSTMTVDGNKFLEKHVSEDGTIFNVVREINGDDMKSVTATKGGSTTLYWTRIK